VNEDYSNPIEANTRKRKYLFSTLQKQKENNIIELNAKNIGQVCSLYLTPLSRIQDRTCII